MRFRVAPLHVAFAWVLASLGSPALAQDADGDGTPDAADALPCDGSAAAVAYEPSEGGRGLILFEDRWPDAGDLDFNDAVISYSYQHRLDAAGRLVGLRAVYDVLAVGGAIHNGLGVQLAIPRTAVASVSLSVGGAAATTPLLLPDANLGVIVAADLHALFGESGQVTINSSNATVRRAPVRLVLDVRLSSAIDFVRGRSPYDVFLFRAADRSHQIHGPAYRGTQEMNAALFNTANDRTNASRAFVDESGVPFALVVPAESPYPAEATLITSLFPRLVSFAASGGTADLDFYANQVNSGAAYRDSAGAGAATPAAITYPSVDRSCLAPPISAPNEVWTYVPFANATCANGTSTGIAVNFTQRSNRVLIFLQGGGGCFNATMCLVQRTAVHIDHAVGEAVALSEAVSPYRWIFDRTRADNPFRDANFVFVPYCTGDVHAGTQVVSYAGPNGAQPFHHVGANNLAAYLARLSSTFPNTDRVWLGGESAGGSGALINWPQTQEAFPGARVDVFDDSLPPLLPDSRYASWRSAFNLRVPAGCAQCGTTFMAWLPHFASVYPNTRFALFASNNDQSLQPTYSMSLTEFQSRLNTVVGGMSAGQRAFIVSSGTHGWLVQPNPPSISTGLSLSTWLTQFATDDPSWATVGP